MANSIENPILRSFAPLAFVCLLAGPISARATDVTIQPAAGSGFVVKDASGANERLRVQESGTISLPSVVAAPAQSQGLCMSASGQLGPCNGGSSGSTYTAGTGLILSSTTFSVAPTYQLPQTCKVNEFAQWNGTTWACGGTDGATLPVGTVNQTLRYDATNKLVTNSSFQAFEDGALLAEGGGIGPIPAAGAGGRLMWYSADEAFRAGHVSGSQWDQSNIGRASAAMGADTIASGFASIAMGNNLRATGNYSVAIGEEASAENYFSIALGGGNAKGWAATALGYSNPEAMGDYSIAIGDHTHAMGDFSLAMGNHTVADGKFSTAMGGNVSTGGHEGSFIYGDTAHTGIVTNTADSQFEVIAYGGVNFFTGEDPVSHALVKGAGLASGSGTWTSISDRNAKTAVQPVDPREVLKKVAALPMNTWQYKTQEVKYRHMGPMAQDFYAAFHLGESDKGIDTVDADGVALAAIQALNAELVEKDRKIATLSSLMDTLAKGKDAEIATLRSELSAQTRRVAALESLAEDVASLKKQLAALRQPATATVALAHP